jgi:hypothetical protein
VGLHGGAPPAQAGNTDVISLIASGALKILGMWRFLQEESAGEGWRPVSRHTLGAWVIFYVGFLIYAFTRHGEFLWIDLANLVVHEGGHSLFGWFGPVLGLWGGTILQWLVPFLLAAYFFTQRQTTAFAFCLFFFFENWLYTATYMADARAMVLPLVTAGDSAYVEHDWNTIFSGLGVLQYDTRIAALVRGLGWCGMLGTVAWLVALSWNRETMGNPSPVPKEH